MPPAGGRAVGGLLAHSPCYASKAILPSDHANTQWSLLWNLDLAGADCWLPLAGSVGGLWSQIGQSPGPLFLRPTGVGTGHHLESGWAIADRVLWSFLLDCWQGMMPSIARKGIAFPSPAWKAGRVTPAISCWWEAGLQGQRSLETESYTLPSPRTCTSVNMRNPHNDMLVIIYFSACSTLQLI